MGPSLSSSPSSSEKHGPRNIGNQRELRQASRWWGSPSSGRKSRNAQGLRRGGPRDLIKHPNKCLALNEQVVTFLSFLCCLADCLPWYLFACSLVPEKELSGPLTHLSSTLPSPPLQVSLVRPHSLPSPEAATVAHLCHWLPGPPLIKVSRHPKGEQWVFSSAEMYPLLASGATIPPPHLVWNLPVAQLLTSATWQLVKLGLFVTPSLTRVPALCLSSILIPDVAQTF